MLNDKSYYNLTSLIFLYNLSMLLKPVFTFKKLYLTLQLYLFNVILDGTAVVQVVKGLY
jgi:hypothetical protein